MPITFPTPTTIGEQFASGGKTWQWNGYAWNSIANASALGATGATGPSANLSNYVLKAGDTMTGKLTLPASTTSAAPINIPHGSDPTLPTSGDIWLNGSLRYRDQSGTTRFIADLNRPNDFTQRQVISADGFTTLPALKITQLGSGEALRVEDSSTPDATAFVVSSSGRVGIGVTPDATVALSVDTTGIKFGNGTIQTTATIAGATGATGPTADLSGYVLKAGDTMTGKLNLPASTTTEAGLNIGNGVNPTSPVTGDAWISTADNLLKWRTASSTISVAASNLANSFSVNQTIQTPTTSTVPALRVTQRGTGEALRVEDDTSPDTTAFVINSDGKVGIGVTPDTSVCLSLDTTGIKFGDNIVQTKAVPSPNVSGTYTLKSIDGVITWVLG